MEREALFSIMAAGLFMAVVWSLAGGLGLRWRRGLSEPDAERQLAAPLLAGLPILAFLLGWVLREPDPADEFASPFLFGLALLAACVAARALVRAGLALRSTRSLKVPVGTFGLFKPGTRVSKEFRAAARPEVLQAALAHEAAHQRGHDPLRIWLAQLAMDLQWPALGTEQRFSTWLTSLERRRDDEALNTGVHSTDLAEAILLAARLGKRTTGKTVAPVARLVPHERDLALRVRSLCTNAPHSSEVPMRGGRWLAPAVALALVSALALGLAYGEDILSVIPGVWR